MVVSGYSFDNEQPTTNNQQPQPQKIRKNYSNLKNV